MGAVRTVLQYKHGFSTTRHPKFVAATHNEVWRQIRPGAELNGAFPARRVQNHLRRLKLEPGFHGLHIQLPDMSHVIILVQYSIFVDRDKLGLFLI